VNPADLPLKDIHVPAPPSWWPPAPGWWVLLAIALFAACILGYVLRRRARTRWRRVALSELRAVARRYATTSDGHRLAAEVSALLRRFVLSVQPRAPAAGLSGSAWIDLLDALSPRARLDSATRRALLEAPYRPATRLDGAALIAACERWLRRATVTSTPAARAET